MFRAWKDAILTHHRSLSGKGLKNKKCKFSNVLNWVHSKPFLCPLATWQKAHPSEIWGYRAREG